MSNTALSAVFHAGRLTDTHFRILVAIADQANEDGVVCSLQSVAARTGRDEDYLETEIAIMSRIYDGLGRLRAYPSVPGTSKVGQIVGHVDWVLFLEGAAQ